MTTTASTQTTGTASALAIALEARPASWTGADESFFRVVAEVFPAAFLAGAGLLLMSYDADLDDDIAAPAAGAGPGSA